MLTEIAEAEVPEDIDWTKYNTSNSIQVKPRCNHTVGELRKIKDPKDLHWREYKTWKTIKEEEVCDIDIDDWYEKLNQSPTSQNSE